MHSSRMQPQKEKSTCYKYVCVIKPNTCIASTESIWGAFNPEVSLIRDFRVETSRQNRNPANLEFLTKTVTLVENL
jgi:hypothetical protein